MISILIIFYFNKININNDFLGDLKMIIEKINNLLSQERHNYWQTFKEDKTRFSICLEKKLAFISLKKYVTLYAILQIFLQINILKEYQLKDETLLSCINSFKRSMGLPCTYILKRRILENHDLLLNDLASHWLFYKA